MSKLRSWLSTVPGAAYVPLFEADDDLLVRTHNPPSGKTRICRSQAMENAVLDVVAQGLQRPNWRGILYVMAWGGREQFRPLYIGKAGRFGKTEGQLSANLRNLQSDKSKFARWGDGNDYHIGDLSQALFGWSAYKAPTKKYLRWSEVLFAEKSPLRLREATSILLVPWDEGHRGTDGAACSLEAAEDQAIELAMEEFGDILLNVQAEAWRTPMTSVLRDPSRTGVRRPISLITSSDKLVEVASALAREAVIGLDVETTMLRHELRLIQIATPSQTYVIDPLAMSSIEPLRSVFEAREPLKIIHNASFERRVLGNAGFELGSVFDTLAVSRRIGPPNVSHGLADVCERHIGRTLDKSLQSSDWSRRPLSREQIEYAAADAEVLIDIYAAFNQLQSGH